MHIELPRGKFVAANYRAHINGEIVLHVRDAINICPAYALHGRYGCSRKCYSRSTACRVINDYRVPDHLYSRRSSACGALASTFARAEGLLIFGNIYADVLNEHQLSDLIKI